MQSRAMSLSAVRVSCEDRSETSTDVTVNSVSAAFSPWQFV